MAGLLGDVGAAIFGDDKEKDEFGQTQMDRRQPIWSGLLKTGAMLMAGGQSMMPNERAKYIAQAGGALADVPSQMIAQRSDYAKQKLAGQQVAEGQRKIANQEKMRAMSQTPEFQAGVAKLAAHDKLLLQAAFDAGDLGAATSILKSVDASGLAAQNLELRTRKVELAEAEQARKSEGPFKGSGEANQMWNYLQKGLTDPAFKADANYLAAHTYFSAPRMINGVQVDKMDLTRYPQPTFQADGGAGGGPGGGAPPKPGIELLPDGTVVEVHPDGRVDTESSDGQVRTYTPGKGHTVTPSPKVDPVAKREVDEMRSSRDQLKVATNDFLSEWKKANAGDRLVALGKFNSPLNRAWRNVALIAKGKSLYELGVLNQGDLPQLQMALADPSSISSAFANDASVEQDLAAMMRLMDAKIGSRESSLSPKSERRKKAEGAAGGSGGGKKKKNVYNQQTGKVEEVDE